MGNNINKSVLNGRTELFHHTEYSAKFVKMNTILLLSLLIALVCVEPAKSESSRGSSDEALEKVEAAYAKNQLKQMNLPFRLRNNDDVPDIFGALYSYLKKIDAKTKDLNSTISSIHEKLSSVESSVQSVKSSVSTLKSEKKMHCLSGWTTFKAGDGSTKTIYFNDGKTSCEGALAKCGSATTKFSKKPAFIAALNQINAESSGIQLDYGTIQADSASFSLKGTLKGTNEATWMACGY